MSETDTGIVFDRVWKKFQRGERHDSLRDLIPAIGRSLRGYVDPREKLAQDQFWAVQDVSFTVTPGDVLGIIGRNGAGKSTILKILTKILPPTLGSAEVRGRVGALIEISAGFHQDLTGRENVFLQGAIMGMPKALIRERFDDIVEFAEVSQFIDTQVKRYSSGMNARLGFAIAAHLSPEVLIIDEVLAVGDFEFQQRAFGRMRELAQSGIPVVVVSHQLDRIAELCTRVLLLERGAVKYSGETHEAIRQYLAVERDPGTPAGAIMMDDIILRTEGQLRSGDRISVTVTGMVDPGRAVDKEIVALTLRSLEDGRTVSTIHTDHVGVILPVEGRFSLDFSMELNVPAGLYGLDCSVRLRDRRGDIGGGPGLHLQVLQGNPFEGQVQLNARANLATDSGEERPRIRESVRTVTD